MSRTHKILNHVYTIPHHLLKIYLNIMVPPTVKTPLCYSFKIHFNIILAFRTLTSVRWRLGLHMADDQQKGNHQRHLQSVT